MARLSRYGHRSDAKLTAAHVRAAHREEQNQARARKEHTR